VSSFYELLHIFLLDVYAQRWHTGLSGIPAHLWERDIESGRRPDLPLSAQQVRRLLGRSDERVIQRAGIEFLCIFYQSPRLALLRTRLPRGTRVRFKYDPGDLGAISVRDPEAGDLGAVSVSDPEANSGWVRVPAVDQDYAAGLSLWKHHVIHRYVLRERGTVDMQALAAAKRLIQEIVTREFHLTKATRSLSTRKSAARFLEIGTGPAPSAPSDLTQGESAPQRSIAIVESGSAIAPLAPLHDDLDDQLDDESQWGGDYELPE
jgi:putative transposase